MTPSTPKFTIIAHLTSRIVAQDISAAAVTAYLENRIDQTRYTVVSDTVSGVEFFSMRGEDWMSAGENAALVEVELTGTETASLANLITRRAALLAAEFSVENTVELNAVEGQLDSYPHRDVMAAITAYRTAQAAAMVEVA